MRLNHQNFAASIFLRDSERARVAHLLRRAGFGASEAELDQYTELGFAGALDQLLHPERVDDQATDTALAPLAGVVEVVVVAVPLALKNTVVSILTSILSSPWLCGPRCLRAERHPLLLLPAWYHPLAVLQAVAAVLAMRTTKSCCALSPFQPRLPVLPRVHPQLRLLRHTQHLRLLHLLLLAPLVLLQYGSPKKTIWTNSPKSKHLPWHSNSQRLEARKPVERRPPVAQALLQTSMSYSKIPSL